MPRTKEDPVIIDFVEEERILKEFWKAQYAEHGDNLVMETPGSAYVIVEVENATQ